MPDILLLSQRDLQQLVTLDHALIERVAAAFATLASGKVVMPPVLSMEIAAHHGEVDVKTAYVPGWDSFAIKISPGFFNNPKIGLPATAGLMTLFCAQTGQLKALLLDNGYLTDMRTAAAGAVAAQYLARPEASHVCIIGAGMQAELQLRAVCLVRPITQATLWARDLTQAQVLARRMQNALGISVIATPDLAHAVSAADIIVTTTPATQPLVQADWLQPGQHITAMGSDQPHKSELAPACLARANRYVPDRQSQTALMGELRAAIAAGLIASDHVFAELGDIVAQTAPGRADCDEITVADLTGTGVQDTAIATLAHQRAQTAGIGTIFTS
jgi:ornithine cyclodeaminase